MPHRSAGPVQASAGTSAATQTRPKLRRWIVLTLVSALLFGVLHHTDHLVRGNHVGWPAVADINPFTYSLAAYPLAALGLAALTRGRVWAGYWLVYGVLSFRCRLAYRHSSSSNVTSIRIKLTDILACSHDC